MLLVTCVSVNATSYIENLDIEGDGNLKKVVIPFSYYQRQQNDCYSFISQGGYKALNIKDNQNEVVVVGPLRPCISVIVTDGESLVAMHKHSSNSLESMEKIIRENIDLLNKEKLYAYIYTSKDDLEWSENQRNIMHNGRTHTEEVKRIKDFLENTGIMRQRIPAKLFSIRDQNNKLRYGDFELGRYELVESVVAVRMNELFTTQGDKQIKLVSIDPYIEDVYALTGKMITTKQWVGKNIDQVPAGTNLDEELFRYEDIPAVILRNNGQHNGYRYQRGVYEWHAEQIKNHYYEKFFKGLVNPKYFEKNNYSKFDFYPI